MILNDDYVTKHLKPMIKKAWLYEALLASLLILTVFLFLVFHDLFTYVLSVVILSVLCLAFLIPIYVIFMKTIYFPIRLSHFIETYSSEDMSFQNIDILSLEKEVTIDHLLFKPIKCIIDEKEKLLFLPCETLQIDLTQKNIDIIISNRFILGVKDV